MTGKTRDLTTPALARERFKGPPGRIGEGARRDPRLPSIADACFRIGHARPGLDREQSRLVRAMRSEVADFTSRSAWPRDSGCCVNAGPDRRSLRIVEEAACALYQTGATRSALAATARSRCR